MSIRKPSGFPTDIVWDNLPEDQKKLYNSLYSKINTLENRVAERRSGVGMDRDADVIMNIKSSIEDFDQTLLNQIEKSLENMSRSGAFFGREAGFQRGLQQASKEMMLLFGSAERAAGAFDFLATNLQGFGKMGDIVVQGSKSLTGALALQQAAFERAGMSASTFKENVDMMVYSFGLNAKEVQSFNFQIRSLAEDLDMMPEQVSRNFQLVAKNLSYDIGAVTDQFARMQKLSLQTGVDVSTISGQFGTGMDTISGASGAAANINALLGRNAFSATELLMMDEATRAESVREAIMNDPRLKASLAKGGPEAKFALDTVKDILGMSRDDAKRFITTGKLEDADKTPTPEDKDASLKSKVGREVDVSVTQSTINKFSSTVRDVDKEFEKLVEDVKAAQLSSTERERLEFRRRKLQSQDPETEQTRLMGLRKVADQPTTLSDDYTPARQLTLRQVPGYANTVRELEQARASGIIKQKQFEDNIKILESAAIEGAPSEQMQAVDTVRKNLENLIKVSSTKTDEGQKGLDRVSITQMEAMTKIPGVGEREIRQMTRLFREKMVDDVAGAQKFLEDLQKSTKELEEAQKKRDDESDPTKHAALDADIKKKRDRLLNIVAGRKPDAKAPDTDAAARPDDQDILIRQQILRDKGITPTTRATPLPSFSKSANPATGPFFDVTPKPDVILPIQKARTGTAMPESQRDALLARIKSGKETNIKFRDKKGELGEPGETKIYNTTVTLEGGEKFLKLKQALRDGILTIEEFKAIF